MPLIFSTAADEPEPVVEAANGASRPSEKSPLSGMGVEEAGGAPTGMVTAEGEAAAVVAVVTVAAVVRVADAVVAVVAVVVAVLAVVAAVLAVIVAVVAVAGTHLLLVLSHFFDTHPTSL